MLALVLFSGGLDSLLALRMIKDAGVELLALNFVSPFCRCNRKDGCSAVGQLKKSGIDYKVISLGLEYLEIVKKPKFGYGSNINPCLDCRIMMFKKAKEMMQEEEASFIITGEVLGQRPMSQQRRQLELIEKETGLAGLILRPLSAKLLPETIPEKEGWIKKDILLALSGRMRSPQIEMARGFGINDYPCPSGGCLLTDPGFTRRMKDLMRYGEFSLTEVELLKLGRHFRLNDKLKLVIGRDEGENARLLNLSLAGDVCFVSNEVPGPAALLRGEYDAGILENTAAPFVAHYCDRKNGERVILDYFLPPKKENFKLTVQAADSEEIEKIRI